MIRWIVAFATTLVCATLVGMILGGSAASVELLHTLCLMSVALAAYAWALYPTAGSLAVSAVSFIGLVWAWAARQVPVLALDLAALGVLLAAAVVQQQRRLRRSQRLLQVLDDLDEEGSVKDQAMALAHQASDALHKKLARYLQLQSIAEALSNMTDLGAIAQLAVDHAFALIGKSDVCLLFLIDTERQELSLFASKKRETIPSVRSKHGDQFDRYVLRTHRPLLVNDARRDFRFTVSVSPERPINSVIACPLLLGQRPEGVLRLDSSRPSAYTQDDLRFLDILLDLVATAMTNARLFAQTQQLAMTDGLTGLALRRPFLEQLTREITRSARSREPVSVLMLDVDHFKGYNDAFGHMAGDLILKAVADILREVVTPGGVIARYGGEEFAVLLPRLSRHQAGDVAEEIRRRIEQDVEPSSRKVHRPVTASLGVASFPDDAQAELELVRAADHRLYQAKRAGRNLVCSA